MITAPPERHWSAADQALLEAVAEQLAIAINQSRLYARMQQQARREAILNEITSDIRNSLDPNQVLDSISQALREVLALVDCRIQLDSPPLWEEALLQGGPNGSDFPTPDSPNLESGTLAFEKHEPKRWQNTTALDSLHNGYPVAIAPMDQASISPVERDFWQLPAHHPVTLLPLIQAGELLGTIVLTTATPTLSEEDLVLAIAVAEQAAIALKQAQLHDQTRRLALQETLQRQVAQALTATYQVPTILQTTLAGMANALQLDHCQYVTLASPTAPPAKLDPLRQATNLAPILQKMMQAAPETTEPAYFQITQELTRNQASEGELPRPLHPDLGWLLLLVCYGRREPLVIEDLASQPLSPEARHRLRSANIQGVLAVPMMVEQELLGILVALVPAEVPNRVRRQLFETSSIELMQALADMAAVAIQRAQFYERARLQDATAAAMRGLSEGREAESRRLAADLHDQTLADLGALSRQMQQFCDEESPDLAVQRAALSTMNEQLRETIAELRCIVEDLQPTAMRAFNLGSALRSLLERAAQRSPSPLITRFDDRSDGAFRQLDPHSQSTLFRIVQEALTNIVKHAKASRVDCTITVQANQGDPSSPGGPLVGAGIPSPGLARPGMISSGPPLNSHQAQPEVKILEVKIIDDGQGMPPNPQRVGSHGLLNMRYRAELVGGSIEWRSRRRGTGTIVVLTIPLSPPSEFSSPEITLPELPS